MKNEIILYRQNEATEHIEVRIENETVWLNRQQIATLFGRDVKTIGKHINNALKEELEGIPTVANFAIVHFDNSQVLELFWEIGKEIASKQTTWGSNIIENVAKELNSEFPEMKGFSRRNLYAIRQWYLFYNSKYEFVPPCVAQIPWGHNRLIVSKRNRCR